MAKIIKLTESDLHKIVKRVIKEEVNATCADGTTGILKFQNGKYGIQTSDGGFCIVPSNTQAPQQSTTSGGRLRGLTSAATAAMNTATGALK